MRTASSRCDLSSCLSRNIGERYVAGLSAAIRSGEHRTADDDDVHSLQGGTSAWHGFGAKSRNPTCGSAGPASATTSSRRRRRSRPATNAYTAETECLMMAGEWPRRPQGDTTILDDGCWRSTPPTSTRRSPTSSNSTTPPRNQTNGRPHDPTGEGGGQRLNWRRPGRSRHGRRSRPIR